MNDNKKFEAYKLVPNGQFYKIINFDEDTKKTIDNNNSNLDKISEKNMTKEKITNFNLQKKKNIYINKSTYDLLKKKISIDKNINIRKIALNSVKINQFKFSNTNEIYNFLFKNSKKISGIDVLKLKQLFKFVSIITLKQICRNAKQTLKIK